MRYLSGVASLAYDAGKCAGCGRCAEVCPHGVFVMEAKRAKLTDRDRCMECGACAKNCEFAAISVASGVGCASALITSMIRGGEPVCGCGDGASSASSGGCC